MIQENGLPDLSGFNWLRTAQVNPNAREQPSMFSAPKAQVSPPTQAPQVQQSGAPTWMDAYTNFQKNNPGFAKQQAAYGGQIDRPWNSDEGTKTLKLALDNDYQKLVSDYNAAHGTDLKADQSMLGINAQPNDWNRKRNSNSGFLSDTISHVGEVVSKSPLAQTVISAGASMFGVPPNVTMALLSANNIGQGQDPVDVAKNIAIQYVGGQIGQGVGAATGSNLAGNVARNASSTLMRGGNVNQALTSGLMGGASQFGSGALSPYVGQQAASALTNAGLTAARGGNVQNSLINSGINTAASMFGPRRG